jgi:peptide subunit release factor 1 (eRF1)
MELKPDDNLECPICNYKYTETVENIKDDGEIGIDKAHILNCDECGEKIMIVEYDDVFDVQEFTDDELIDGDDELIDGDDELIDEEIY